jgi:hypothetical protein
VAFTTGKLVDHSGQIHDQVKTLDIHPEQSPNQNSKDLTIEEIEFLLMTLRESTLKGHQVEFFYNLAVKLQTQYIQKKSK